MIKKIFYFIVLLSLISMSSYAKAVSDFIKKSDFEFYSTTSIYVKNKKNNKVIYKKNEKKLLNPASTLKLLTFGAAYKVLGENYKFETAVYQDLNSNLYIKLGADPMLSSADLVRLFRDVKEKLDTTKINNIYIDSTIIDKTPYPSGWMQEDIWPKQRMITPYIVDDNLTDILLKRSSLATNIDILQSDDYKIPIINELRPGNVQNYSILKNYGENSPIITFNGTLKEDETIKLPVLNPEINFVIKISKALNKNNYLYDRILQFRKIPSAGITKIASCNHTIETVSKNILYLSDNFTSEVVSKVAAAKHINYSHPATNEDMIKMFHDVYGSFLTPEIKITDSSGVSRNNFLNTDFMVNAMIYIADITKTECLLPASNTGTLTDRLLFLKDNLRAKTGTLADMSGIMGMLNSKKCNKLYFAIIIQNTPKRKALLKNFEDNIITLIWRKY